MFFLKIHIFEVQSFKITIKIKQTLLIASYTYKKFRSSRRIMWHLQIILPNNHKMGLVKLALQLLYSYYPLIFNMKQPTPKKSSDFSKDRDFQPPPFVEHLKILSLFTLGLFLYLLL